jgi:ribosomal protein S18 acetylase RimI-like enzyme
MADADAEIRRAGSEDAAEVARLFYDFNTEFDEPTPDVPTLRERFRRLLEEGEMTVLLAGGGPDGFALLRFRPSLWSDRLEAYLQELYVVPPLRGRGIGRALMEATIVTARAAGADSLDLNTGETDTAARALYTRMGFTNREGSPDGPAMLFYEREL